MSNVPPLILTLNAINKSNMEALLSLNAKAVHMFEKLGEIQNSSIQENIKKVSEVTAKSVNFQNPQEFFESQSKALQTAQETMTKYVSDIHQATKEIQSEVAQEIEKQNDQLKKTTKSIIDNFSKHAPIGSEHLVSALKTSFDTSVNMIDSMNKTINQTQSMYDSGVKKATGKK